ncbi:hypothetical protein [Mycolicibacterium arenosum]|uniref:Fe2OG dioxygenase domain-containing protein n=1 Tax=Mycolicibacterium arenosum TaxID=2952157 RepID=A0ABT1M9J5_9MYCO|nr:hypothetical protein [Mycolicibacterium sp. CAU 1645]MCP9275845.1 hypothetical protein [Mycolicibacterium sp. CAU 1645]
MFALRLASAGRRRAAFHRRTLMQSRIVRPLADARYATRIAEHVEHVPAVSVSDREIIDALEARGVSLQTIDMPEEVLGAAYRLIETLRETSTPEPCVKASPRQLSDEPDVFIWGLSNRFLDLAENYIGLPPRYLGVEVKRELVRSAQGARHETVRSWHLDHEDRRILKVIVYLSDVDDGAGPFGYVDRTHTARVSSLSSRQHHAVSDERMADVVPRSEWHRVTGPRFTTVYADTGQVFHRVFAPTCTERYSVTFAYSSHQPYYTYERLMLPRHRIRALWGRLTPRQRRALGRRCGGGGGI